MKKMTAVLMAFVLILSLAACGESASDSKSESSAPAAETVLATQAETKEEPTEAENTEVDDDTLIKETLAKLVGNWTYGGMEDYVTLTFNEDGTGSFDDIDTTGLTFTYTLTMEHKEFNNGEPYIEKTLKMTYSTGETEEIVIDFLQEGQEQLTFHNTEGGGYNGVITDYGAWIRK